MDKNIKDLKEMWVKYLQIRQASNQPEFVYAPQRDKEKLETN